jgi:hypothetical protein
VTVPLGRAVTALRTVATSTLLAAAFAAAVAGRTIAASPTPDAGGGGDPRSPGQGPGLVGDPLAAVLIVLAIAIASVVATLVWIRVTGERRRGDAG